MSGELAATWREPSRSAVPRFSPFLIRAPFVMQDSAPYFAPPDAYAAEPPPPSTGIRVVAALGGAAMLLVGSLLSFGMGFVALVGLGITALLWRARGARLTRRASWIGAVLAVGICFGGFMSFAMSRAPGGFVESMQASMKQASQEPPPPIVQRMRRVGPPPNPLVQQQMDSMTESKGFIVWTMVMTVTFGSLFFGLVVGTPAWGCVMLIGYGLGGRWPMQRPSEPARP